MCEIVTDGSESFVFVSPVLGEVNLAARGRCHAIKNCGGHWLQRGFSGADHVNGNSGGLGEFCHVLRRYDAGIVWTVREYYDDFSARVLSCVFQRQQECVVKRRLIPCHGRAHCPNDLRSVGSKRRGTREISAVRIECNLVRISERTNKLVNGVLREDKAPIHIVTGVKQDEYISSAYQRVEGLRRCAIRSVIGRGTGGVVGKLAETTRRFIAFRKSRCPLGNPILRDDKILGAQSGNVVSVLVGHRHVQLDHIDHNAKVRALLSLDTALAEQQAQRNKKREKICPHHKFLPATLD